MDTIVVKENRTFKVAVSREEELIIINSHQEDLPKTGVRVLEIDAPDFILNVVGKIWGTAVRSQIEDILACAELDEEGL